MNAAGWSRMAGTQLIRLRRSVPHHVRIVMRETFEPSWTSVGDVNAAAMAGRAAPMHPAPSAVVSDIVRTIEFMPAAVLKPC